MKKIVQSKLFAVVCLAVGLAALLSVVLQTVFPSLVFPIDFEIFGGGASLLAYFTILSNIFAGIWLTMLSIYLLTGAKALRFAVNPVIQGALTLYVFITGVVYFGILSWAMDFGFGANALYHTVNYINHLIVPLYLTALWFLPLSQKRLMIKDTLYWLIFPLLYFVFSMIRGAFTNFYPYPFLDPNILGSIWGFLNGYFLVGIAFVLFVGVFIGAGYALMLIRNRLMSRHFEER